MSNHDKYFKGQTENEEFVCFFRQHWIALVKEFLYFGIFIFVVMVIFANLKEIKNIIGVNDELKLLFFTGYVGALIFVHRFFLRILNYFIRTGIITNIRVIDHQKTLYFKDNFDSIRVDQIQNVERIGHGLLQNILNYGNIRIYLNAASAVKTFHNMPNAKFHFRCINRQMEKIRMKNIERREHREIEDGQNPYGQADKGRDEIERGRIADPFENRI